MSGVVFLGAEGDASKYAKHAKDVAYFIYPGFVCNSRK